MRRLSGGIEQRNGLSGARNPTLRDGAQGSPDEILGEGHLISVTLQWLCLGQGRIGRTSEQFGAGLRPTQFLFRG
jgi:hypothetical protein